MLGADVPQRAARRRQVAHPLVSLRSPLPLLVAGIGMAILVIAVVTLPPRPPAADPSQIPTLSDSEALTLVAHDMRSPDAAARVLAEGQVRFDDGTWYVTVSGSHYHFSQRNRIVVADDQAAVQMQYRN
ncbi:MAG: hypothetical protein LC797_11575 [Chloroflexi bacterium]|nr:hypothetical protein [Chloroflexota bacterium]